MKKENYICTTCGIQYEASGIPPGECIICEDERQYRGPDGQTWTTLQELNKKHKNVIERVADNIYAIYSTPPFAIGQRAHLIVTPQGNILWDCISYLDTTTIDLINRLGGINAIAISHPHYFTTVEEWSMAFSNASVYINDYDAQWLTRSLSNGHFWNQPELEISEGIRLVRCGGHFPGASVLNWKEGRALLVGDTIQVAPDLKTVSFMYSYPNMIPLPKKDILAIWDSVKSLEFESIYGAFGRYIREKAKDSVEYSVQRYLKIFE